MPFIYILVLSLATTALAKSPQCGLQLSVPLNHFDDEVKAELLAVQSRAAKKYKKTLEESEASCPKEYNRLSKIFQKIVEGSANSVQAFRSEPPKLVVLCGKNIGRATARYFGGRYVLAPRNLAEAQYSDSHIAAIFAHEVAHYSLNHLARLIDKGKGISEVSHSERRKLIDSEKRRHEKEADLAGLEILVNAGFKAQKFQKALEASGARQHKVGAQHSSFALRSAMIHRHIRACKLM